MSLKRQDFSDILTFTRGSEKTYFGKEPDGFGGFKYPLKTAAVDEPAFDHDPVTGEALGISIHEQRTNYFTNSNDLTAASWTKGSAGTGSVPTISTSTETLFGLPAQEIQFNAGAGTTSSDFSNIREGGALPADAGDSLAQYAIIKSLNGEQQVYFFYSGTASSLITVTEEPQIIEFDISVGTSTTYAPGIGQSGECVVTDGRFLVAHMQAEKGALRTPPVFTSGTQATRQADVCSIDNIDTNDWFNPNEGTFVFDIADVKASDGVQVKPILSAGTAEGASGNDIGLFYSVDAAYGGGVNTFLMLSKGVSWSENLPYLPSTVTRIAFSFNVATGVLKMAGDGTLAVNSGNVYSLVPNDIAQLLFSSRREINFKTGLIKYKPADASDAELQELSKL